MPEATYSELEDSVLVKKAIFGDTQAFGGIYERYAVNIYRFFCAQLADTLGAEDLTSEVFLRAWSALPRYRERGYPFSAFLFKIARNALIDYRRKNVDAIYGSQEGIDLLPDNNPMVGEQIARHQSHRNLWRLLNEMKENYRTVLVLRFINGLSTREVARIMDRSEGSVRVLQHRGLKALREKMEGTFGGI